MKSANPIIFSPHPTAKNCIAKAAEIVNEAAMKAARRRT
jgi:hypothetical protein